MTDCDEFRVDMHVKVLDEQVVQRAKDRSLDALVYAPHFVRLPEIRRQAERFSDDELLIVPAREVFTGTWRNRKHVLAVGLTEPVPDFITLTGAMQELDRQGAAVLIPHPEFLNVGLSEADICVHGDVIHAVETYNPKQLRRHNRRAKEIVEDTAKPAFGSSYAHLRRSVGEAWTTLDTHVKTAAELVERIRDGGLTRVVHRNGRSHELRRRAEFAHLGWENTWGKFNRLILSGMEATHPDRDEYDGRFDDVSVY
ncbi:Predicted metal-dependent phosphoesterase TrpH, contains PHP domain [Haladaptatus litoreus]|uniref:Predicted metal-dependent phosphoesterase TrpH, contains PHP domain n=2 Tax=Haladaptatus litoreus TaxID=553468 RepID=A0A1N6WVS4_9EURY|nr:Predicted metal-dependent phosphoesterase TrpH, contains PHP domain [Haladaptatus litoreus]